MTIRVPDSTSVNELADMLKQESPKGDNELSHMLKSVSRLRRYLSNGNLKEAKTEAKLLEGVMFYLAKGELQAIRLEREHCANRSHTDPQG